MQFLAQIQYLEHHLDAVPKTGLEFSHVVLTLRSCLCVTGLTRQHPGPPYRLLPSVQAEVQEDGLVPIKLPAAREQPLSSPHNYSAGPVKKPETLSRLHYSHTAKDTA